VGVKILTDDLAFALAINAEAILDVSGRLEHFDVFGPQVFNLGDRPFPWIAHKRKFKIVPQGKVLGIAA
jgi:hypothetical protein